MIDKEEISKLQLKCAKVGKEKLEEAKAQIREKRYGLRLTDKEVITLAIVIINENKDETHGPVREVAAIEEVG